MASDPRDAPHPPRLPRLLVRLLIRGRDASYIVSDLDTSFARDVERGIGRARAARRYAWNALASVWSVWTSGLRRLVTHGIGLDAKLGLRMLVKQPLITAVTVLALGLGIPASLLFLHGMDVLFSDLPVPDGHRVVGVRHYDVDGQNPLSSSMHDLERWQALESLESIGAVRSSSVNIDTEESGAPPVRSAEITASSFDILRARPLLGRVLDADDELDGAPAVALLGESLWSARFARDPGIVGQSIRIGRTPHTVVGVMPADFQFPSSDQVWLPLRARAVDSPVGDGPQVMVFGRLADGVSLQDARAEISVLTERRASDDPERFEHLTGEVVGMATLLLNEDAENSSLWSNPELLIVQALIFGLLLVVCGNVGTLILARTAARSNEITIRTALGASRARILTQLFVETLVLATVATGLGLLLANRFASWLMGVLAPHDFLPYWADLTLTPRFVGIALGLAALCAAVAGVLPALSPTRRAIQANLQRTGVRSGGTRFGIGSSVLIVSQIILSVGVLALGATGVRTAFAYQGDDLGFDPDRYVYATLTVPEPRPMEVQGASDSLAWQTHLEEIQRELLRRLSEDPAVVGVAMGAHVPGLSSPNGDVILETPPAGFDPVESDVAVARVDVSFFAGLGRPILAGRDFNAGDAEGPPGTPHTAVIVNESFVRHHFGGRSAVGQRFRYEPPVPAWRALDEEEWYEIVGVVGSFGTNPENSARDAAIYHPLAPGAINPARFTVEVAGDPEAFVPRLRQIAASVDPVATVSTGLLAATIRTESLMFRSTFLLVLALAGAAFLLAATGLYALMSFTISQRTQEIGIRSALGASTADIVSAVTRRAALQVGAGLALGIAWGWVLLDNSRNDVEVGNIPLTLALTAAIAGSVCLAACAHPTLRGLRIQPTEALRES
jgi:putative ABC transport system permease protein